MKGKKQKVDEAYLYAMQLHEEIVIEDIQDAAQLVPPMKWRILRVATGWIYQEENERISRPPISLFVPLTYPQNPTI